MCEIEIPKRISRIMRYETIGESLNLYKAVKYALDNKVPEEIIIHFMSLRFISSYRNTDNFSSISADTLSELFRNIADKKIDKETLEKLKETVTITFYIDYFRKKIIYSGYMPVYNISNYLMSGGKGSLNNYLNKRNVVELLSFIKKKYSLGVDDIKCIEFKTEDDCALLPFLEDLKENLWDYLTYNGFFNNSSKKYKRNDEDIKKLYRIDSFINNLLIFEAFKINKAKRFMLTDEFISLCKLDCTEDFPTKNDSFNTFSGMELFKIMKALEEGFINRKEFDNLLKTSSLRIINIDNSKVVLNANFKVFDSKRYLFNKNKGECADINDFCSIPRYYIQDAFRRIGCRSLSIEYSGCDNRTAAYLKNLNLAFKDDNHSLVVEMLTDFDLIDFYRTTDI